MKKRVFHLEHVLQLLLLTRPFYLEYIPLSIFIVVTLILLRVKYQVEGFTLLTFLLIALLAVEILGEAYSLLPLFYLGSIIGGLLYFVPLKMYWLPEPATLVGFRQDYLNDKLHYYEFYPLDQTKEVRLKSMKWNHNKEIDKMIEPQNISNKMAKRLLRAAVSYADKHKLKIGDGTESKTTTNIVLSHGKGGTPLHYSSIMMHFAGLNYRIGGVQHNEVAYIRLEDIEAIRTFRQKQVIERAKELTSVVEKLDNQKIIMMAHSYGCATTLQAYYSLEKSLKSKVTHLVLLDPWLFPLKEPVFNQQIDIPVLILANETFVNGEDIYLRNKQFSEKHNVEYLIWAEGNHLHQSDFGFISGNLLGFFKNSTLSREQLDLNFKAIDLFLKGQKVEGQFGQKDLGRHYTPTKYNPQVFNKW